MFRLRSRRAPPYAGTAMSTHRLFVALRPPRPIRQQLLAAMHGISGARWQDDEQLHLTLRFIGEVDHHRAEDIAAALGSLYAPAIEARIETLRAGAAPAAPEGFTLGGHDALWDRWRMGEIARLNRDLATLRLELDDARRAAALATARSQVLSRLAGRDRR